VVGYRRATNDYSEGVTMTQTPQYDHFFTWALPYLPQQAQKESEQPQPPHIALGNRIAEKLPGFAPTVDAYGKGPEEHGSAWKIDGDKRKELTAALRLMGYRPRGSTGVFFRRPYQVDIGYSEDTTWVYITDDNTRPVTAKKEGTHGKSAR
jgi:hypothetical protein